jgi:hypothetical protein
MKTMQVNVYLQFALFIFNFISNIIIQLLLVFIVFFFSYNATINQKFHN